MVNWSKLWDLRNEPVSVIIAVAILVITATTIALSVNQIVFRKAPLICGSQYFPEKKTDCEGIQVSRSKDDDYPVGTIVAFFGRDSDLPKGWTLCDGRDNPQASLITVDADAEKGGIQLPDLRGRFVRGTEAPLDGVHLSTGGEDGISFNHSHVWSTFQARKWYSYDGAGNRFRVDDWDNGIGNQNKGNYPLVTSNARNTDLHTDLRDKTWDNRPAYAELRYIIRIF